MSILTQTILIADPEHPLDEKSVVVPVHKHQKIYCTEPYVLDALKKYDSTFSEEEARLIERYEQNSFKEICEGLVTDYSEEKSMANISLSKKHSISIDVNSKHTSYLKEQLEVGKPIEIVVAKNNGKMFADATSKAAQVERITAELIKQIQTPTSAYAGIVKDVIMNSSNQFNGFLVDISGVKCFMPGSEADVIPLDDYNSIVGETMYVMPINVSKESIVVSHKSYLNTLRGTTVNRLIELGKDHTATGVVTAVKNFGVFILIDKCVPTLLSVSEMNAETEEKFKNGEIKKDDLIDFYVDSITEDRLTITQTISKSEGWNKLAAAVTEKKELPVTCTVKNTFENGIVVVAQDYNEISFFISGKVLDVHTVEVGKTITITATSVDVNKKTVRIKLEEKEN